VKAAAEHVAASAMIAVETSRPTGEQIPHALVKVRPGRYHDKVNVVVHEAVGAESPLSVADDASKVVQEVASFEVTMKENLAIIATGGDVVGAVGCQHA
jgi:hypothetical protein